MNVICFIKTWWLLRVQLLKLSPVAIDLIDVIDCNGTAETPIKICLIDIDKHVAIVFELSSATFHIQHDASTLNLYKKWNIEIIYPIFFTLKSKWKLETYERDSEIY